jgi:Zn-dependent metalloprotease
VGRFNLMSDSSLLRLASDPRVPEASRQAFLKTIELDRFRFSSRDVWRGAPRSSHRLTANPAIVVFDCKNTESLPGTPVDDPQGSMDGTVGRAFVSGGQVLQFYQNCFNRNSVDDAGATIESSVHFSTLYCNAGWNGVEMIYGDGDGSIFRDFTLSDDFVGHELTHGVTQYTAGLEYTDEPGALNESISDSFGSMFRQWHRRENAEDADWLIGSDLMGPVAKANGWICVRDMYEPGASRCLTKQPDHYSKYVPGGDPHDNSGIVNRAFCLAAKEIGGITWQVVGKIWYSALTSADATSTMSFKDFARLTINAASVLFPRRSSISDSVHKAWSTVGVTA